MQDASGKLKTHKPFILNISSAKVFQRDRLRWLYEWYYDRTPRDTPQPLTYGKIIHEVFDKHLSGETMPCALKSVLGAWLAEAELKDKTGDGSTAQGIREAVLEFGELAEVLEQWVDQFPVEETLEVETAFEYPHPLDPNVIIRGRPDRVVRSMGRLWHVQNRSLNPQKNIGLYTELAQLDMHELIYKWAIAQKYKDLGLEVGGTIFNIVRKLKYRAEPTKKDPEGRILRSPAEMLGQYAVWMDDKQVELALKDVLWIAKEMQRTIYAAEFPDGQLFPAHNRDMNGGLYGSKKDPYTDVILGKISLWDDKYFKPREDTYAPITEE